MTILRRWLLALWILCFAPAAFALGDIGLSSLAQKGLHHELIAALAPLVKAGEEVSSFRLLMLSGAYYEVGKYRESGETADLLERRINAGDSSMFGGDLSAYPEIIRGQVALDQGLYAEAVRHTETALARLKPDQIFYRGQAIHINGILGVAQAQLGKTEEARRSVERIRAVNIERANLGPEKYTAMARIQAALKDFQAALVSIENPEANVSPLLTMFYDPTFHNLPRFFIRAKSLFETGQVAAAKRAYDDLLQHPQITQYGSMSWLVLYDRARIAVSEGDLPGATELLRRAVEIIEQRRSAIANEAGRIGFVGDKQDVYAELIKVLLLQGRADAAYDAVERAKSRALVDMLAAKMDFSAPGSDPEQLRTALAVIDKLDRAVLEKEATASAEARPALRNIAVARAQIVETAPALAALVTVGADSTQDIAARLTRGEVLVEYYYAGSDFYAFVLKGGGQVQAIRLAYPNLEQDIQALRQAMERIDSNAWQDIATRLHAGLWQPLEPLLAGTQNILIVAHGVLHYLPFAVLRAPNGKLLVERHGLHFLPSASVLKFLAPEPAATRVSLLALGNPDLGDPRLDLKFAADEARAVSKMYPDARLLLGQEATETNFRKAGNAFRRLHIASHGSFSAEAPLTSGLHLAKDAENDGLLTVGELYSMELPADLVTLSACETGLGRIVNGDDVVGLTRGFLYAGARSIVASLWSVDDKATEMLMASFYRNLATLNKLEALRRAQLAVRRSFPHPFFWAAFQLTGRAD